MYQRMKPMGNQRPQNVVAQPTQIGAPNIQTADVSIDLSPLEKYKRKKRLPNPRKNELDSANISGRNYNQYEQNQAPMPGDQDQRSYMS